MTKLATAKRRNGTVRCAIYTRKSPEEGLDQEFNSLLAQGEAREAFITSQRHEAWVCLRTVGASQSELATDSPLEGGGFELPSRPEEARSLGPALLINALVRVDRLVSLRKRVLVPTSEGWCP